MSVIELKSVSKLYGRARALDDVTWSVPRGRLMGFLGPNGAGKTTTIRILMGFLRPSHGASRVFGLDAWHDSTKIRARIGYLPGEIRLYPHLNAAQTIRFVARARGSGGGADAERLAEVFDLDLGKRIRNYSSGMRQKLGLILAMMHKPELLILDEPSSGLDPLMQQVLRKELLRVVEKGRTVLFSSHSLPEAEQLCEEVAILRMGRLVASERVSDLRLRAGHRVYLKFARPDGKLPDPPEGLTIKVCTNEEVRARWQGDVGRLMDWLADLPLQDVTVQAADLEDLFIDYYGPAREEES